MYIRYVVKRDSDISRTDREISMTDSDISMQARDISITERDIIQLDRQRHFTETLDIGIVRDRVHANRERK